MQFTAAATGAAAAFSIDDPNATAGLTTIQPAQDAQLTLWGGTTAQQAVTSATNKFDGLLPGLSLTVSAVSTSPVHVAVARDSNQISKTASDLVGAVNTVLAQISTKSTVVASTDGAGNPITSGGPFTGDSTVRSVNDAILSAASQPVNGRSPSEIGIVLTKTGTMQFDSAKFADAMAKDPTGTMAAVGVIAGRVADAAKQASDPTTGLITTKILGQQSDAKDINNQIASWDDRLAMRRATLQQTYSALEVALSGMKAQSSWLTAQLGGATSGSSGA
ncbi:flagellar filament capping protein FliD [Pseudarthrobacter sp. L19]|uniref:flagellar filament capping protein FliD n=1 Tax=Pseudarthrobacter sp. L19 TaxID=3423951 RepID=UPI003D7ACFB2